MSSIQQAWPLIIIIITSSYLEAWATTATVASATEAALASAVEASAALAMEAAAVDWQWAELLCAHTGT